MKKLFRKDGVLYSIDKINSTCEFITFIGHSKTLVGVVDGMPVSFEKLKNVKQIIFTRSWRDTLFQHDNTTDTIKYVITGDNIKTNIQGILESIKPECVSIGDRESMSTILDALDVNNIKELHLPYALHIDSIKRFTKLERLTINMVVNLDMSELPLSLKDLKVLNVNELCGELSDESQLETINIAKCDTISNCNIRQVTGSIVSVEDLYSINADNDLTIGACERVSTNYKDIIPKDGYILESLTKQKYSVLKIDSSIVKIVSNAFGENVDIDTLIIEGDHIFNRPLGKSGNINTIIFTGNVSIHKEAFMNFNVSNVVIRGVCNVLNLDSFTNAGALESLSIDTHRSNILLQADGNAIIKQLTIKNKNNIKHIPNTDFTISSETVKNIVIDTISISDTVSYTTQLYKLACRAYAVDIKGLLISNTKLESHITASQVMTEKEFAEAYPNKLLGEYRLDNIMEEMPEEYLDKYSNKVIAAETFFHEFLE